MGIEAAYGEETTVIILDLGNYNLGVMVDQVNSVITIDKNHFAEKPNVDSSKIAEAIMGIFRKEQSLILILDIAKALSVQDRSVLNKKLSVA